MKTRWQLGVAVMHEKKRAIPGKMKDNDATPEPDRGASIGWYGQSDLDERSRALV